MSKTFRLLKAVGEFQRRDLLAAMGEPQSSLRVEFAENRPSDIPWTSVVIGKNGVGKSRLLAGIADTFDSIYRGRARSSDIAVSEIVYECDGHICQIEMTGSSTSSATIDGRLCDARSLPLPNKVIALTTTPFDKFRVPPRMYRSPEPPEGAGRYVYLGLRERSGRASPTATIFRAIEGLFEASRSGPERRSKIAEVFGFLGYKPHVEVRYEISKINFDRLDKMAARPQSDFFAEPKLEIVNGRPIERLIDQNPHMIPEIRSVASEALDRAQGKGHFALRADFGGHASDHDFFERVQILRQTELIRMRSVVIEKVREDISLDLKQASSGELGIVTGFLGIASAIEAGSLIFIDEPEISLHPEWQAGYIDLLMKIFGSFSGCHFVLATHSPLILADITKQNSTVVSLGARQLENAVTQDLAGQSVDHLLVTAFGIAGKNNLYLKQELIKALRLAAEGKSRTEDFARILRELREVGQGLDEESPVKKLITELEKVAVLRMGPPQ